MRGTTIGGAVTVLALLLFAGAQSFGLLGAVLGPLIGGVLFFAAIRVFSRSAANDDRDRRLVNTARLPPERDDDPGYRMTRA